ncbi:helix-turn-helix domain-containing protein [Pedobacter paludis]|uniref:HTH araC/xylS-type domain-containing protein n=1 Tax=Pedobacter paludis TaxID=2203212 RepID=A0A317EZE7_9SPHI|nr:AraC family transcriptional regulator [Pedobacter paludis]PWS32234.1 hypothetical protein DF947_10725 [Pedobacter paludis]
MRMTRHEIHAVKQVHSDLRADFISALSISVLAEKHRISAVRLMKGFIKIFGISINYFHLKLRMDYAKIALMRGTMVKEIAITLGYSTTGSFTRAFKKIHQLPPSYFLYGI